jgi:hypothetical protein
MIIVALDMSHVVYPGAKWRKSTEFLSVGCQNLDLGHFSHSLCSLAALAGLRILSDFGVF